MQLFFTLLGLISIPAFLVGGLCLIYPIRRLGIGTRRKAGLVMGGAFLSFVAFALSLPSPVKQSAQQLARQRKADMLALLTQVTQETMACRQASDKVGALADGLKQRKEDDLAVYSAAIAARETCQAAQDKIQSLKAPESLSGESGEKIDALLKQDCPNWSYGEAQTLDIAAQALDSGAMAPDDPQNARDLLQTDTARADACLSGLGMMARDYGADNGQIQTVTAPLYADTRFSRSILLRRTLLVVVRHYLVSRPAQRRRIALRQQWLASRPASPGGVVPVAPVRMSLASRLEQHRRAALPPEPPVSRPTPRSNTAPAARRARSPSLLSRVFSRTSSGTRRSATPAKPASQPRSSTTGRFTRRR